MVVVEVVLFAGTRTFLVRESEKERECWSTGVGSTSFCRFVCVGGMFVVVVIFLSHFRQVVVLSLTDLRSQENNSRYFKVRKQDACLSRVLRPVRDTP